MIDSAAAFSPCTVKIGFIFRVGTLPYLKRESLKLRDREREKKKIKNFMCHVSKSCVGVMKKKKKGRKSPEVVFHGSTTSICI